MGNYNYPRVPRSTGPSLTVETTQGSNPRASTFSWVATPAEAEGRTLRPEDEPPVPQIPQNISAVPNYEAPAYTAREELPRQEPVEFAQDMKHRYKPEEHPPPERQAVHYAATTTDPRQQYQQQYQQQYEQPPPEPPKIEEPEEPPPVHYTVGPDENPLHTPTTPTVSQPPRTNTTNIPIIPPPPSPSHFPSSNYNNTPAPSKGGTFTSSLFSCSQPSICLPSLLCPCLTYGRTQYRLSRRSSHKDPTNLLGYTAINGSCIAFGLLCGVNGILAAIQHTRVRRAYAMDGEAGNVAGDCVKGCCCCCCVVAQDEKEVKGREEEARRNRKVEEGLEGYGRVEGMVFGVPPR